MSPRMMPLSIFRRIFRAREEPSAFMPVGLCRCGGSLAFMGGRLWKKGAVDTSLLSLLPASEGDPLLTQANTMLSQRASRLLEFVAEGSNASSVEEINHYLKDELKPSEFVQHLLTEISPEQQKAFYDLYFPFRYQMLSPNDRERLEGKNPLDYFVARLIGSLYSPASSFLKNLIPQDPFLFFPELVRSWASHRALLTTDRRGYRRHVLCLCGRRVGAGSFRF